MDTYTVLFINKSGTCIMRDVPQDVVYRIVEMLENELKCTKIIITPSENENTI